MNLAYHHLINPSFHPQSKVWVYQANRLLTINEAFVAEDMLTEFVANWKSHGDGVKAEGYLFFGQFVVLMADESEVHVGGCSTDSSVRFIKLLGERLNVDFFDRNLLAFVIKDKVQVLPYAQVPYAVSNHFITPETLYFNNLVATKQELQDNWLIPVQDSWLAKRVLQPQP
ncbi:MAG: hypothetical protein QM727_01670 [Niabella sp.]